MKRWIVVLACVLPFTCAAQQPDIRLQVLSLYSVGQATIHPVSSARVQACATCKPVSLDKAVRVFAGDSRVTTDLSGGAEKVIRLTGDVRIELAGVSRVVHEPLEVSANAGMLRFIIKLPLEDYVAQVVQGETSGDMPTEALNAMAVAARTYATHFRDRHRTFDFCDSTHCQFVRPNIEPSVASAVKKTRGEILWSNGHAISAHYHQDCGGRTESGRAAWGSASATGLPSQTDPYCVRVAKQWRAEISRNDIDKALSLAKLRVPRGWTHLTVSRRTPSGRAQVLEIGEGRSGGIPVSASALRFAIGRAYGWGLLKSDKYEVVSAGDRFVFTGRGTGHGVGLCQLGAAEMARQGKRYRDILAFYYPGATLSVAAGGLSWQRFSGRHVDVEVENGDSRSLAAVADRALEWAQSRTALHTNVRPVVQIFPSVQVFRDATGEPGWVAASTRGTRVRTQPSKVLGERFEAVLRHEFVHLLLEMNVAASVPLWFREGMALVIMGEVPPVKASMPQSEMEATLRSRKDSRKVQEAYAAAAASVQDLECRHGRAELLRWLRDGLPAGMASGQGVAKSLSNDGHSSQPR